MAGKFKFGSIIILANLIDFISAVTILNIFRLTLCLIFTKSAFLWRHSVSNMRPRFNQKYQFSIEAFSVTSYLNATEF